MGGLTFRKLDLHVHTPASHDFHDKSVTPDQIVDFALSQGLDGIAVTDHNSGAWIDKLKNAAAGKGLSIIPGVEISCGSAGTAGIHVIALFDTSTGTRHVETLLGRLGLDPDQWGHPKAIVNRTITDIFDEIALAGGIPIAAHANSSKGLLCDMRGQARTTAVKHPTLLAAECTDYLDAEKARQRKRVVDLLDGSDPEYQRRLAVYQASDNPCPEKKSGHALAGIGSRFTFFKLESINLEGLRQCFVHPETRIRFEHSESRANRLLELVIRGSGFLGGETIRFNRGLNSIVGGKGVGKSLIVELIRFMLENPPQDPHLYRDHVAKIEACLCAGDTVELSYEVASGKQYRIKKTFNGPNRVVTSCEELSTGDSYKGQIPAILPILAYSQTEILKIAESPNAQRNLIDQYVDIAAPLERQQKIRAELADANKKYVESYEARTVVEDLTQTLATLTERLSHVNASIEKAEPVHLMEEAREASAAIQGRVDAITRLSEILADTEERIGGINIGLQETKGTMGKESVENAHRVVHDLRSSLVQQIQNLAGLSREAGRELEAIQADWKQDYEEVEASYLEWLKRAGGDIAQQEALRESLSEEIREKEQTLAGARRLADRFEEINKVREGLLDSLAKCANDIFLARQKKYESVTSATSGRLRLSLVEGGMSDKYGERLVSLLGNISNFSVSARRELADRVDPRTLVKLVLNNDVSRLAELGEITSGQATRVIERLKQNPLTEILELQHEYPLEDEPIIEYEKAPGVYSTLDRLSVGQKCSALLIIALTEGEDPVLIDQPEDALDVVSIWEDVSQRLIASKERRQFIITTHNSSVAVAADSDQFHIVTASSSRGRIEQRGAIDSDPLKSAVIQHLEGGKDPYKLRQEKYGRGV